MSALWNEEYYKTKDLSIYQSRDLSSIQQSADEYFFRAVAEKYVPLRFIPISL